MKRFPPGQKGPVPWGGEAERRVLKRCLQARKDFAQIAGKSSQKRYGYAKDRVNKEVDDWSKGLGL